MTPFESLFVTEYLIDLNATKAYERSGGNSACARARASELRAKPHVKEEIDRVLAERAADIKFDARDVLRRLVSVATADPNEIVRYVRRNCRHCNGIDFQHQWIDEAEWAAAIDKVAREHDRAMKKWANDGGEGAPPVINIPTADGGFGFNGKRQPVSDCPKCLGEGIEETWVADTRTLSASGRALYAGIKKTKDGIEVKMHDQQAALNLVMRHLGMLNDKLTVSTNGITTNDAEAVKRLTTEELMTLVALRQKMAGGTEAG